MWKSFGPAKKELTKHDVKFAWWVTCHSAIHNWIIRRKDMWLIYEERKHNNEEGKFPFFISLCRFLFLWGKAVILNTHASDAYCIFLYLCVLRCLDAPTCQSELKKHISWQQRSLHPPTSADCSAHPLLIQLANLHNAPPSQHLLLILYLGISLKWQWAILKRHTFCKSQRIHFPTGRKICVFEREKLSPKIVAQGVVGRCALPIPEPYRQT